jgi:hypothetical protein
MLRTLRDFGEVVVIDFEFRAAPGERPVPVCLVAREQRSGRMFQCWLEGEAAPVEPPFAHDSSTLLVAYFASAELGCYQMLGWPFPRWLVDPYAEFRIRVNGLHARHSLLDALRYFGIPGMDADQKDLFRKRILAGPPYNASERRLILAYCETDVTATERLLPQLIRPNDVLTGALVRGEYMKVVARIEHAGVPLDAPLYHHMAEHWTQLQSAVVARVNDQIPVYDGRSFRHAKFETWVKSRGLLAGWPLTLTGKLAVDEDTLKEQSALYPELEPLRQVRQMLGQMRRPGLHVGGDGRNRYLLSPFKTKTGRNAPSTTRSIFGAPSFMRGLIRPELGKALAYIDWSQQEFGIAAALSGDAAMQESYRSGDPYLAFARYAGAVPADASKASHPRERSLFKTTVLGVQYQIGAMGLAHRLGTTIHEAGNLLDHHRRIYNRFWGWSDAACDCAQLSGFMRAALGWSMQVTAGTTLRTMRNFPMQANGAEMLRLATIFAHHAGVRILAPVHDAMLIEAAADDIEHAVALTQTAMRRASEVVLAGFPLRTDAQIICYPDRFCDERGITMWRWMQQALSAAEETAVI